METIKLEGLDAQIMNFAKNKYTAYEHQPVNVRLGLFLQAWNGLSYPLAYAQLFKIVAIVINKCPRQTTQEYFELIYRYSYLPSNDNDLGFDTLTLLGLSALSITKVNDTDKGVRIIDYTGFDEVLNERYENLCKETFGEPRDVVYEG